jgi:hypothetical protein
MKMIFILNILFEYEKQIFFIVIFPIFHTKHDENEINKHRINDIIVVVIIFSEVCLSALKRKTKEEEEEKNRDV